MFTENTMNAQYFTDINHVKIPSNAAEERMLFERYHEQGDTEARRLLIEGGLRFVVKIARQYYRGDVEFLHNLIAAGNIGLIIAVDRYRPWMIRCYRCHKNNYVALPKKQRCQECKCALRSKDAERYTTRFLTYAAWWITEAIRTTLYESPPIHIPHYKQKEQHRCRLNDDNTGFTYTVYNEATFTESYPVNDTEYVYITKYVHKILYNLIKTLKDRQAYVVIAYYGLREDRKTLREISEKLGVCPERVRQIKENALTDMRTQLNQLKITNITDICAN